MRVVAGTFRGRALQAPKGTATRPTADRVREAIFSILASVEGTLVLDLFAGSGALGIEALSRGAAGVTFVDSSAAAVAVVNRNLESLGLSGPVTQPATTPPGGRDPHSETAQSGGPDPQSQTTPPGGPASAATWPPPPPLLGQRAEVLRIPALRALACTPIASRQYDLVFLDPPYRMASLLGPELSTALPPILAPEARVVVESDRRAPLVLDLPLLRERHYGDTLIRVHGA